MRDAIILLQWCVNVVRDALNEGQVYRSSMIVDSLLFHINSYFSYVHHRIECRLSGWLCRLQHSSPLSELIMAVLSLNSLCQFILCINNLSSQEVISFGEFNCLHCCLDHMIQSFSMMLCSIILRPFPMLSFFSCLSHDVYWCLPSRFLCLYWGDSLWDLSSSSLDGRCTCPSCSCPSLAGCESFQWDDCKVFTLYQGSHKSQ